MASIAGDTVAVPGRPAAQRLRAAMLAPRGGGTTRRRASDAFRLILAVVGVVVSIPIMKANSAVELTIVHALNPPPTAIRWLVTPVFWLGSVGVIALMALAGLLVPRLAAIRSMAIAAVATWLSCVLLGLALGPAAGRPSSGSLAGLDPHYPVTQFAVTIAVAATALPYLSRPLHRLVSLLVTLASVAVVVDGSALPVNTLSSLAIGWGGGPLGMGGADLRARPASGNGRGVGADRHRDRPAALWPMSCPGDVEHLHLAGGR